MSIKYLGFNVPVLLKDGTSRLSQHLKTSDIIHPNNTLDNIEIINDKLYKIIPRYGSDFIISHQNKINNKEQQHQDSYSLLDFDATETLYNEGYNFTNVNIYWINNTKKN
jgi:hypothetical protein